MTVVVAVQMYRLVAKHYGFTPEELDFIPPNRQTEGGQEGEVPLFGFHSLAGFRKRNMVGRQRDIKRRFVPSRHRRI